MLLIQFIKDLLFRKIKIRSEAPVKKRITALDQVEPVIVSGVSQTTAVTNLSGTGPAASNANNPSP